MPLISKPNYNQVFASQAPDIDKPAVFNNYPEGWGPESRPNNGKPTIKGFNYLQQTSDLKDLWILQNGACLPYDESIEYAEGAPVLKDGVIQYKNAGGFSPAISEKPYILSYFTDGTIYPLNARVMLENGDIVKSTAAGNTVDPNVDMTGWSFTSEKTLESISELLSIQNPFNGMRVYVKSYHAGLNKGGGAFVYDTSKSSTNDGGLVINGWVREYDVPNAYMFGAKGDGALDEVSILNNAIQVSPKRLDLAGGTYKINPLVGLVFKDNFELWFKDGAKIESLATSEGTYELFKMRSNKNIRIYNLDLRGDKNIHTGTTGEWGHGVNIVGCENIFLYKPKVTYCWGDGIYIGSDQPASVWGCKDVTIIESLTDNNGRNGLTIIGGTNIRVQRPTSRFNNRILPMAGIGIEPNRYYEPLNGIKIVEPYTEGNGNVGCYVGLRNYQLANSPIFDVTISDHVSKNEGINGFLAACNSKGVIHYTNPTILNAGKSAINLEKWECSARLYIDEPYIYNANTLNELSDRLGSAISLWRDSTLATQELGGLIISKPTIIDDRATKLMRHAIFISDGNTSGIGKPKDVMILDPVQIDRGASGRVVGAFKGAITDPRGVLTRVLTDAESSVQTLNYTDFAKVIQSSDTKAIFLTLAAVSSNLETPEFTVINNFAGESRVIPPAGVAIYPLGAAGKYLSTTQKGASLTLVPKSDGWYITNMIGTWTSQA